MRLLAFLLPALAAAGPIAPTAVEARAATPSGIQILSSSYSGSGCGTGSVGAQLSSDKTTLTLIFDSYIASYGPGTKSSDASKNCVIKLGITYPKGYQYSVVDADYRGYAALDQGVTGTQSSSYYFTGLLGAIGLSQSTTTAKLVGPQYNDYSVTATAKSASLILSPCGPLALTNNAGLLVVDTKIGITSTNKTATGYLTTDSADFKTTQVLSLKWQPCSLLNIGLGL